MLQPQRNSKRRSFPSIFWTPFYALFVCTWAVALSSSVASGAGLAYDGFDYTGSLVGKSGGSGFAASWASAAGYSNPALATGSMPYSNGGNDLVTAGNKVQPSSQSRATRNFSSAITTANQTRWVSFRINHTGTGTLPAHHAGFMLSSGSSGTGGAIFLGKPWNATNWGIDLAGTVQQKSGSVTTADRNAILVYKLVFTASQVTVSMWVNPAFTEGSLGTAHATLTGNWSSTIASMMISTGNTASNYQFDEFRFGTTFGDVVLPTVIAYEGFNYTGTLNGKTGGTGYGSNTWTAAAGFANPTLATGSMSYTSGTNSLVTSGNKVQPAQQSRSTRNFADALPTADKTMWVSFRINQTDTGTLSPYHAGFMLTSGSNGTGSSMFLGKPWNVGNWGVDLGGTVTALSGNVSAANRNALLVYKLAFTSTNVTVSMWVNPPMVESSLGAAALTASTSWSSTIASTMISTGNTAANYQFDEYRVGNSFDGVAPIATGNTIVCNTSTDLINALSSAAFGDTIVLTAGNTFTAPTGGFILPEKSGTGWITIQSSALGSLPAAGVRVFPTDAANMPRLRAANAANEWVMKTAAAPAVAHHYKLIGLEIIGPTNDVMMRDHPQLEIGRNDSTQNSLSLVPHDFIIDRCYFHENSDTQIVKRNIGLHGKSVDITNCYFTGGRDSSSEGQCIWGNNGPGPFNIINNFVQGAGENIMFGGAGAFISGSNPTDIVVQRNHFYKPTSWIYGTPHWHVKNLFELKCGVNVTIDGNVFENCWADAGQQYGTAIAFKTIQGASGGSLWFNTENITFTNNLIQNVGEGVFVGGSQQASGANLIGYPKTVTIRNNLFADVNNNFVHTGNSNRGWLFQTGSGTPDLTIDHNTGFSDNRIIYAGDGGVDHPDFVFTNNMVMRGSWGIFGGGSGEGENALADYYPNCTFLKNVNMGSSQSLYSPDYLGGWSPASLGFPSSWSGVLDNQASPGTDFAGWKVDSGSAYENAGTDGKDIGCDIDAVNAATAGCITGVWQ